MNFDVRKGVKSLFLLNSLKELLFFIDLNFEKKKLKIQRDFQ